ncbi:MAG TPA: hypothetical protein VE545_00740 [Candidatus Dormibacteraeota bacterium]|nr:hypothetical protein [Candidatus Dormibacteraeota bacterium]
MGSRDAWRPCSRRAVPGSAFCGRHTEVAAGIMLGLVVHGCLKELQTPGELARAVKDAGSTPPINTPPTSTRPQRMN